MSEHRRFSRGPWNYWSTSIGMPNYVIFHIWMPWLLVLTFHTNGGTNCNCVNKRQKRVTASGCNDIACTVGGVAFQFTSQHSHHTFNITWDCPEVRWLRVCTIEKLCTPVVRAHLQRTILSLWTLLLLPWGISAWAYSHPRQLLKITFYLTTSVGSYVYPWEPISPRDL